MKKRKNTYIPANVNMEGNFAINSVTQWSRTYFVTIATIPQNFAINSVTQWSRTHFVTITYFVTIAI